MSSNDARIRTGDDAVREYVALDRALTRLEVVDPAQSAGLRLQLNRARKAYLRAGDRGLETYLDLLTLLGAASASALQGDPGVPGGSGPRPAVDDAPAAAH